VGLRVFGQTLAQANASAKLAANQGLYNGFLAAGLVASLIAADPVGHALALFSLSCVIVAGVFGGYTVKKSILVVQALPAAIALALLTL
jgi:putative membrane protein